MVIFAIGLLRSAWIVTVVMVLDPSGLVLSVTVTPVVGMVVTALFLVPFFWFLSAFSF